MFEITKSATKKISEYLKGKEIMPIRIFLQEGGWSGPSLAMALDEPKETDNVFDIDGFKYIIDKDLMREADPIKIDFSGFGLRNGFCRGMLGLRNIKCLQLKILNITVKDNTKGVILFF